MYGLKYTIPFKTLSNISCEIRLEEKDFSGTSLELRAGETPIVIDVEESDLLAPIRSSGATIQVYGSDYLQDLYTSDPQGIKVTLLRNGSVYWIGFLTPDTFSQDFSSPEFIYELECVSAFSTLKYKEFDLTDDTVSFLDIINRARDLAGYADLYLTSNITTLNNLSPYDKFKVPSLNFYDELSEAMTYYECLEEIAKFLGCCFTTYEDDLYLIDYHAIKNEVNSYIKYVEDTPFNVTLADVKEITKQDYRGTGAKLSRISGKNKITVNCSLYEIENLLPSLEEGTKSPFEGMFTVGWKKPDSKLPKNYLVTVPVGMGDNVTVLGIPVFDNKGSRFLKVARYTEDGIPNKLSFTTELMIRNYNNQAAHDTGNRLTDNDIVLKMKSKGNIYVHNKVYFAFSHQVMPLIEGTTVTSPDGNIMVEQWGTAFSDTVWKQKLKLRIGNYFYNGTTWTTTDTTFLADIEIKKDEKMFGRFIPIKETNDYTLGIGDLSGWVINPPSTTIFGELELSVYNLWPSDFNQPAGNNYGVKYVFMKDISLEYAIQDLTGVYDFTKKENEDVIYESDINSDYIDEAEGIDLKICTNIDNKLAYSSIIENGVFSEGLKITSLSYSGIAEEGIIERAIELYSKPRYVINPTLANNLKPYSLVTEPNLTGSFVVAGSEEDVKMESCTYNLTEI